MGRILLAWELGENYGHISMLLPLARQLRLSGHAVLFAIKKSAARQLLDADGFDYVFSPPSTSPQNRSFQPASFADILGGAGFANLHVLTGLVRSWQEIFNLFQPTVVVSQYAPIAQFAARHLSIPSLQLNIGFDSPPAVSPFPCFRPYLNVTREQLLTKELIILEIINMFKVRQGAAPYRSLPEAVTSDMDLLVTLPELDHYRRGRSGRFIGPLYTVDDGAAVQWPELTGPRVFVYLRPISGIAAILETLSRGRGSVIAVIPGIDDRLSAKFSNKGLYITQSLIKLADVLPNMDLAINHANHGIMAAALLAGVPMLVIPTTIEKWLVARNIEYLGIGVGVKWAGIADEFPKALKDLNNSTKYRENAKKIALKYGRYDQRQTVQRLATTIERLPAWIANKSRKELEGNSISIFSRNGCNPDWY